MGKGDKRTRRGKIIMGSFGKTRNKKSRIKRKLRRMKDSNEQAKSGS